MDVEAKKAFIRKQIKEIAQMARDYYPEYYMLTPKIKFSTRMTSSAGKFRGDQGYVNEVIFSVPIMESNFELFIERTTYHEMAHWAEVWLYDTIGHGKKFKNIMKNVFNRTAEQSTTYHNYKASTLFPYICPVCGHKFNLSKIRHNKMVKGTQRYIHNGCGKVLVPA